MAVKKKAIIIPVVIALIAGGSIYGIGTVSKKANEAMLANMKYSVVPAGVNDLSQTISTTGKVIGNGTVDVTTKLNCTVSEVKVSLGDQVNEGDLLCVFDSAELQEEYDSLAAQLDTSDRKTLTDHDKNIRDLESAKTKKTTALNRAQRTIDKAVKARDNAYNDYNDLVNEYNSALDNGDEFYDYDGVNIRLDTMYDALSGYDEAVTAAYDAYSDTRDQCDDAIQALQDVIDAEEFDSTDSVQKQLDKLADQIEQCNVYAPKDGIITALNVSEGSIPMSSSIMTIVGTDKTVIELTLKETDITKISEGMEAKVTSKVLPDA